MFSVVIPLFNKQESIKVTLPTVLAQTFQDFEILVVNDGSTDNSKKAVESFDDSRIKIIDKPNGGVSSARNRGIAEARFEYVAFIDGDDLWNKDFLKTIYMLISDYPQADAYVTGYSCNSAASTVMYTLGVSKRGIVEDYFKQVYKAPFMHASSVCITKKAFEKVGVFNQKITHGEDYNMWDRLGRHCIIAASPEAMASYRVDTENRAMNLLPPPEKLWIFHVDGATIKGRDMKRYYARYARRAVLKYMEARRFKWAFKIMAKSRPYVSWYSYFLIHEYKDLGVFFRKITRQKLKK